MTKHQRKHLASILGIYSVLTLLGGCQKNTQVPTTTDQLQEPSTQDTTSLNQVISKQHISISNRCIGCGKCARIAPETFTMQGRQAQIISQNYIQTAAVQQAKSFCPTQAIEIL